MQAENTEIKNILFLVFEDTNCDIEITAEFFVQRNYTTLENLVNRITKNTTQSSDFKVL